MKKRCIFIILAVFMGTISSLLPATSASGKALYEAGISTGSTLLYIDDAERTKRLKDIQALGANWIRVDFSWPEIQPFTRFAYNWGAYDALVAEAAKYDISVLAVLTYTPGWAQDPKCTKLVSSRMERQRCQPKQLSLYGDFVAAVAKRYKHTNVKAWELWNEPNLTAYWKVARKNKVVMTEVNTYAAMINRAAFQLRKHAPGTAIITGGLAPLFEPGVPRGLRQSDFLAKMLPQLNKQYFDGVGIHPYSWPVLPGKGAVYNAFYTTTQGPSRLNLRAVMHKAGWKDKQLWATEFGAPTQGTSTAAPSKTSRPDHVTEATQAKITRQGVELWYKKSYIGPLFLHADSDRYLPERKHHAGFGLRREDDSKKPAYDAYRKAIDMHVESKQLAP